MSRDTSFYYSFLVLPPRKRSAIIAVWDFCRAVDDAVDEAPDGAIAHTRLSLWRDELTACYAGGEGPTTPQGRALQPHVEEFRLPRRPFEDLIDGVEMDLAHVRYQTFAELADYCRRVASAVGLVCVEIFGYRDPAARAYAIDLGMALQLTNIIRDVTTDLRKGRVYLPAEDLARFHVTEDDLRAGQLTPAVRGLMRFECERARFYYTKAASTLPAIDRRSLLAAEIMGAIYFEILRRIERSGYDVFSRRIRVPRPYRALIALRLWARALFAR
ncbi:MAG TPA: presqualene diphosphate synthase HpnD [Vicinamibacterales bacterium]